MSLAPRSLPLLMTSCISTLQLTPLTTLLWDLWLRTISMVPSTEMSHVSPKRWFMGKQNTCGRSASSLHLQPPSLLNLSTDLFHLQGKETYLSVVHKYASIHATVFLEKTEGSIIPSFVTNHGIMSGPDLHRLLGESKVMHIHGYAYACWCETEPSFLLVAIHRPWLPLWRPCPSGGHCPRLHLHQPKIWPSPQQWEHKILPRQTNFKKGKPRHLLISDSTSTVWPSHCLGNQPTSICRGFHWISKCFHGGCRW